MINTENETDNRKRGEASPTSHRLGAGVVAGILGSARGTGGCRFSTPAHIDPRPSLVASAALVAAIVLIIAAVGGRF
jgi:hypothetical protein